jgi:DNA polymerase III subunit epsilon
MKNVLVFDSETTGLPAKGANYATDFNQFPHVVQLAWWINGVHKSYIVKPDGWEIPEEATKIHGITTEQALLQGVPFAKVADEYIHDCMIADIIIGHNIHFDSSIIKANILRMGMTNYYNDLVEPAMDKSKRICTMMKTIKFVDAKFENGRGGKFPRLEELYAKLFDDSFPAHNAHEDVKATLRCVEELLKIGIIEIPADCLE